MQPLRATVEDKEETQETTASLVAAKGISEDAGVVAVRSELDGIFTFKEEQRTPLKVFYWWKRCFLLYY